MRVYAAVVISLAAILFGNSSANDGTKPEADSNKQVGEPLAGIIDDDDKITKSIDQKVDDSGSHSAGWMVGITDGLEVAERIARNEGFSQVKEIPKFKLFHFDNLNPDDKRHKDEITRALLDYKEVHLAKPVKMETVIQDDFPKRLKRQTSFEFTPLQEESNDHDGILCAGKRKPVITQKQLYIRNDPFYRKQWFMRSCDEILTNKPSPHGLKLIQTWEDFGVSGKGVKVVVIDGGVQSNHLDLDVNPNYSYNFVEGREGCMPPSPEENHGTLCAGVIAMKKNNGICGVGIAPEVTLGGVVAYSPGNGSHSFIRTEAYAFKAEEIDIVLEATSNPIVLEEITEIMEGALKYGVEKGRGGKGILYVKSAGNRKKEGVICSTKDINSNLYVITIGGVNDDGTASEYAERCSNITAVTYSGAGVPYAIVSTDTGPPDSCTDNFNGTSASSPMAAGLLALVLEANPNLTWRDIKHLLAWTSEIAAVTKNGGFFRNAAGFYVSLDFGFGLINIYDMVEQSKTFVTVPPQHSCVVQSPVTNKPISPRNAARIVFSGVNGCRGTPQEVIFVEDVQLYVKIQYGVRGNIQITLTSPSNTVVPILERRPIDKTSQDIDFTFHSVFFWGEKAQGDWTVNIFDEDGGGYIEGIVETVRLVIYGTDKQPEHYKKGNRKYFPFQLK